MSQNHTQEPYLNTITYILTDWRIVQILMYKKTQPKEDPGPLVNATTLAREVTNMERPEGEVTSQTMSLAGRQRDALSDQGGRQRRPC